MSNPLSGPLAGFAAREIFVVAILVGVAALLIGAGITAIIVWLVA